ncbi:MAG: DNA-3-methyladenine glycosylase 2 family protein [Pyrinomonadaceae bacterium]|nr:DNA-3-methyladenine glycosylase 2 family protein [Pyrinomonadaceae bacterium]
MIHARAPFDFAATAKFLRFTEAETIDLFDGNVYRRLCHINNHLRLISVKACGTRARPALAVRLIPAATDGDAESSLILDAAVGIVQRVFSVDHHLKGFQAQVAADPVLSKLETAHRGLHLPRWPSLFETLVISILSQQISTVVAMTLKRRVVESFGERLELDGQTFFAFPRPGALANTDAENLRALGISRAKAASIIELARATVNGSINADKLAGEDNETVIRTLSDLRGVGRWTAEWALMLYFGRTDVFPAGDLAVRGVLAKYYDAVANSRERDLREFAQKRWGQWASYATIYILAGLRAGTINLRSERVVSSTAAGSSPRRSAGK